MKSSINQSDREKFWIKCLLNHQNDDVGALIEASIKRAYRDFNRTLHGIVSESDKRNRLIIYLSKIVNEIRIQKFESQEVFDFWHKNKCESLKSMFQSEFQYDKICIGQCQKWINMTLKYLFILGEDKIPGIETNYHFFHIPIDNIIQKELSNKYQIDKIGNPWSKIENYADYLKYQKKVREKINDEIPMDIEIRLFNNAE